MIHAPYKTIWSSATLPAQAQLPTLVENFKRQFDVGNDNVHALTSMPRSSHPHPCSHLPAHIPAPTGPPAAPSREPGGITDKRIFVPVRCDRVMCRMIRSWGHSDSLTKRT